MNRFFFLPELTPHDLILKLLCLAGTMALVWWVSTFVLLHVFSKTKGDLSVGKACLWSLLFVFLLTHIYALLELNYNLGELGATAMRAPSFYARFLPEIIVSGVVLIAFILQKSDILQAIKVGEEPQP